MQTVSPANTKHDLYDLRTGNLHAKPGRPYNYEVNAHFKGLGAEPASGSGPVSVSSTSSKILIATNQWSIESFAREVSNKQFGTPGVDVRLELL